MTVTRSLQSRTVSGMIFRWLVGAVIGTTIIGLTSPWFIRSYLPLSASAERGVWVLEPGQTYRWRSEGYADTMIGPMGMPGRRSIAPVQRNSSRSLRVALWGDSQAEGVSVTDQNKLFAAIEQASNGNAVAFPLARSGENAADWVTQMPRVETALGIELHLLLIVDLEDLISATEAPLPPPSEQDAVAAKNALAKRLPAFVIQAARNLLTQSDGMTPRELRFAIGPPEATPDAVDAKEPGDAIESMTDASQSTVDWASVLKAIDDATTLPIAVVYAPKVPMIVSGRIVRQSDTADEFETMKQVAASRGIHVIDVRNRLLESADAGRWPHGFHNGQFGSGHLNADGNRVIAESLNEFLMLMRERPEPD
ncbi:SGNH/GDSL hydrolase family protein [Stieleria varia]|uniref:Uncharacterized protein n=1 Tax=Stieleria varia TaxID=2528005 RepID=A0A5C6AS56_9BACT|nr:SGNH/GDSL hydrolase family protein [Stieleria varia]TWU02247.1 hypothetical protein Pla52n_32970 [Stieleria varia]